MTTENLLGADEVSDFDFLTDVKEAPLVPAGYYSAIIQSAKFSDDLSRIAITVQLQNNVGFCSDGETPLDGSTVGMVVFLPLDADKNKMTASGKSSKWQWKINRLNEVMQSLNVNVRTKKDIQDLIANGTLCSQVVTASVVTREYKGRISSEISNFIAT